jgi:hypothetical protein
MVLLYASMPVGDVGRTIWACRIILPLYHIVIYISKKPYQILRRGAINDVAALFNFTRLTVSALWKRGIASHESGGSVMDVFSRKRNCGRKRDDVVDQLKVINKLPFNGLSDQLLPLWLFQRHQFKEL